MRARRSYLVRFAEVGREAQAGRRRVRDDLARSVRAALPDADVSAREGRLLVETGDERAREALAALPGVTSFSQVERCRIEELPERAVAWARAHLAGRFAVRMRRRGRHHHFSSAELAAHLGAVIRDALPALTVDLRAPERVLGVEVEGADCFLFGEVVHGVDRTGVAPPGDGDKLLVDQMLGRLAAWLRLAGVDAALLRDVPDSLLLRVAREEGRVLLTRDRGLAAARSARVVLVTARETADQLVEVARAVPLHLSRARLFTRCTGCNVLVAPVAEDAIAERLPPSVRGRGYAFTTCPSCGRLYWRGGHAERILGRLAGLLRD